MRSIAKVKIGVFLLSMTLCTMTAHGEDTIMSGGTVYLDLNKNRVMDSADPVGVYQGGNRFDLTLTPSQAQDPLYQQGNAKLFVYGGINLATDQPHTAYLSRILEYQPAVSLPDKIVQTIGTDSHKRLTDQVILSLERIEAEMDKIRTELPGFLAVQEELFYDPLTLLEGGDSSLKLHKAAKAMKRAMKQNVSSHKKLLLNASKVINKNLRRLNTLADENNFPALIEALNTAITDGDIVDSSFATNIKEESVSLKKQIEDFWKRGVQKLGSTDSIVSLKDIEVRVANSTVVVGNEVSRLQAIKLLRQTSFTSYETEIEEIMLHGEEAWINKQLNAKSAHDDPNDDYYGYLEDLLRRIKDINDEEGRRMIENPEEYFRGSSPHHISTFYCSIFPEKIFESNDQLRHRMAYALSQIVVLSSKASLGSALVWKSETLLKFYDELYKHSLGNYRDVLKSATMSSAMAYYLTYLGNKKETATTAPDENYARELMQLFSLGVYKLNLNGTKQTDDDGNFVPSYTQEDVSELARVFTGWDWWHNGSFGNIYGNVIANNFNLIHDLEFNPGWHDFEEKTVLGTTIPAGLDGEEEIDYAIDILMNNPNMAPHVSRHLIMRFVTSNPTPQYVGRVAKVFNDNGNGVKGDLKATLEAILTDDEARGINQPDDFGKVDQFLLAFTHFSSRLNVQELRGDDKYWLRLSRYVPELPMSAGSVFNFYTNEDRPNDKYFMDNDLVAPEMTSRSDHALKTFMKTTSFVRMNGFYDAYAEVELNIGSLPAQRATTWEEWLLATRSLAYSHGGLKYDLSDIYEYFIPGHGYKYKDLRGNGLFHWRWDFYMTEEDRQQKLEGLLDFLSIKFLGKKLPDAYRELILEQSEYKANPAYIVQPMIRRIVSTSQFMVLD